MFSQHHVGTFHPDLETTGHVDPFVVLYLVDQSSFVRPHVFMHCDQLAWRDFDKCDKNNQVRLWIKSEMRRLRPRDWLECQDNQRAAKIENVDRRPKIDKFNKFPRKGERRPARADGMQAAEFSIPEALRDFSPRMNDGENREIEDHIIPRLRYLLAVMADVKDEQSWLENAETSGCAKMLFPSRWWDAASAIVTFRPQCCVLVMTRSTDDAGRGLLALLKTLSPSHP